MDRSPPTRADTRTLVQHHDALDLEAAIAAALVAVPVDEQALRDCVWTYVRGERQVGVAPAAVILALSEMVQAARIVPEEASLARTREMILWCVEAYFGRLGGDALGRGRAASPGAAAHAPVGVAR